MRRAQNPVKHGSFWPYRVGRRLGRRPLSPTERRETPSARTRPGGPWPDLSAYARQPARGPAMLAHRVAICWPILRATWAHLVAMLAYVCLMLAHVEPKDPKNGNSKKTPSNAGYFDGRRPILGLCWPILGLCWPILRAMWAQLGAMLAHLGAMLAHLGAMLAHLGGYVGPYWGYVGPS